MSGQFFYRHNAHQRVGHKAFLILIKIRRQNHRFLYVEGFAQVFAEYAGKQTAGNLRGKKLLVAYEKDIADRSFTDFPCALLSASTGQAASALPTPIPFPCLPRSFGFSVLCCRIHFSTSAFSACCAMCCRLALPHCCWANGCRAS